MTDTKKNPNPMAFAYFSIESGENVSGWFDAVEDADDAMINMLGFNPFVAEMFQAEGYKYELHAEPAVSVQR
jgi:hypothetical protein